MNNLLANQMFGQYLLGAQGSYYRFRSKFVDSDQWFVSRLELKANSQAERTDRAQRRNRSSCFHMSLVCADEYNSPIYDTLVFSSIILLSWFRAVFFSFPPATTDSTNSIVSS